MDIKEVKQYAKDELSSDEKLLESILKFETIYNKHKVKLFAVLVFAALSIIVFLGYNEYKEYQYNKANDAFMKLVENPDDKEAIEILKNNNQALYDLYSYQMASAKSDTKRLKELSLSKDELIADLSKYTLGIIENRPIDSKYYHDLYLIIDANNAISKREYQKATNALNSIAQDSPLIGVVTFYKHYTLSGIKR